MPISARIVFALLSLSARRAWIEIAQSRRISGRAFVALRKESVDRNINQEEHPGKTVFVALRKESVDRNGRCILMILERPTVALRKESVDRNAC